MKRQMMVLGILAVAAQAVPAWAGDVVVVTTLPAQVGTNFKSNIDLSGAVSLKHVVSFNGGGFVVYDKATGKVVERLSQSEFWTKRVAAQLFHGSGGQVQRSKVDLRPVVGSMVRHRRPQQHQLPRRFYKQRSHEAVEGRDPAASDGRPRPDDRRRQKRALRLRR